ncbi:MAG: preprotein translocase subunit SecG [Bacteroidia bacterium]|nr:preprotein translocase subunit SecG [Bacteroidia bacterium]
MYYVVSILILITCILIILIVLVQNSKGGGLVSNFASSNQFMGVRKTTDFLEKATWTLAVALLVLSLVASATIPRDQVDTNRSKIQEQINNAAEPGSKSNFPTTAPAANNNPNQPAAQPAPQPAPQPVNPNTPPPAKKK